MKYQWLKRSVLIATIGCSALFMTGCEGEKVLDTVLEKTDQSKTGEENQETETEPEMEVGKPELITNLSGSVTYQVGDPSQSLKIEASSSDGGTITYQWYQSQTNVNGGGTAIEGATNSTYAPSTAEAGTMYYYAVATNTIKNWTNRITSDTAEVIVTEKQEEAPAEGQENTQDEAAQENQSEKQEGQSEE